MNQRETELPTPRESGTPDGVDPTAAVLMFRSLADPARLLILRHLALGEHRVVDLTAHVGLAQSTTSAHLACLKDCGLVTARTVGRSSYYALAAEPELMDLLAAAERLLAATGEAVVLCPTWSGSSLSSTSLTSTSLTSTSQSRTSQSRTSVPA